jgi:hypothetical protein
VRQALRAARERHRNRLRPHPRHRTGARPGDFPRDAGAWVRDGKIKYREDIVDGLRKAPEAFIKLLRGGNFSKMIVKSPIEGPGDGALGALLGHAARKERP